MEDFTNRKAKLGISASDKDISRDITINVDIIGRLPLFSLAQSAGTGPNREEKNVTAECEYNLSIASALIAVLDDDTAKNVLVDPEDVDRYKAFARVSTMTANRDGILYYDSKFKDIILLPDLVSLGTDGDADILKSRTFTSKGYIVGGYGGAVYDDTNSYVFGVTNSDFDNYPVDQVTGNLDTKTHYMLLTGAQPDSFNNSYGVDFGTYYIESDRSGLSNVIGIGSTEVVFGGPTHLYKAVRTTGSIYQLIYAGRRDAESLTFVLPW